MLYIITAMHAEAAPFIKHYNLKRDRLMKRYELYTSKQDELILLITGTGKLSAAMAVTELLVTHVPSKDDYLVNIGVCGSCGYLSHNAFAVSDITSPSVSCPARFFEDTAPVYIVNDILDHDTGRHYYPDMLFKHAFTETGIETCSVVINDKSLVTMPLVDMEASAIYQAASSFFSPHRMAFLKIPSDILDTTQVTRETVTEIIEAKRAVICEWLSNFSDSLQISVPSLTSSEQMLFDDLSCKLNLSVTMKEQLHQLFIYRKLTKGNLNDIILPDIPSERITNQKRKILFEQFRQQFLQ